MNDAARFDASPYARFMGMRVLDLGPGYARVAMTLREEHLNFAGYIHGGVLMSLADQAFGCATNPVDALYVATQFNIHFLAAASVGDTLIAEARVVHAGRSSGVTEMRVQDASDRLIALATGAVMAVHRPGNSLMQ